ncbi:hypothetical protein GCM10010172_16380 [Paractinoplanes ferrugineus]|uniref:Uncharacterized protein n=1 Tax=Paractinoplanes ferrugineus TaxID=113564 RepID=A0A919MJI7_9ACTN|nr:hypothetical protein [Actinoplanes ferrugineus]GIE10202.1 hypothetical protein Afe05nite_20420 [Actinoplanes ferrugineus]
MKKLTRILTMGGFGLLAALATGAGPANAAPGHGAPEHKSASAHQVVWRSGDQVVGYYRTLRGCDLAGRFGERTGQWDVHNCSLIRIGLRSGAWALQVDSDNNWNRIGFVRPFRAIGGFPTQFRPIWPGVYRPFHPRPVFGHPGGPVIGHPVPGPRGPVIGHPGPPRGPIGGHPAPGPRPRFGTGAPIPDNHAPAPVR